MKVPTKKIFHVVVYMFAIIGVVFTAVYFGMRFGLFNVRGSNAERNAFFADTTTEAKPALAVVVCTDSTTSCAWNGTPEWAAIKGGLEKDAGIIRRVSAETGISARMIAAAVVPEQTRFFTANRETFKSYFEPLKLLGTLSKFSLGVSGIKQETAEKIEAYALDPNSEFYPGERMDALIAYTNEAGKSAELYRRLTDTKDHYYQYLYTALFLKQIESQWLRAGYDISRNAGALVTLFNIGFQASQPKAEPRTAGAAITTGGKTYVYGQLGALFYESDELIDLFPRPQ